MGTAGICTKRRSVEPGPPMTLGNMRRQGVHHLIAYCPNDTCRHHTAISVDHYADAIEVPSFGLRMKYSKCGGKRVDVRPNWKEKAGHARQLGSATRLAR